MNYSCLRSLLGRIGSSPDYQNKILLIIFTRRGCAQGRETMTSQLFLIIESLGIFVFALSGALTAARKGMDVFGFMVLALMPAVGAAPSAI